MDADAAMAWLESLAAKQGVSEEELLTSPDERSETPPDWVQESVDEATVIEEDMGEWIAEVPETVEQVETSVEVDESITEAPAKVDEPDTDIDFDDPDSAMAWLESLAAKQGVSEEELLTSPDERSETPPDWVIESVEAEEEKSGEIAEAVVEPPELEAPESPVEEISPDADRTPTLEEEPDIAPPSWISNGDIPEDDDYSWLPSEVSDAISAEAEEVFDLNEASLIQLERLPGVGFRRAQAITAYRDEHGEFSDFDDLLNVPGLDQETIELLKTRVSITAPEPDSEPELPQTGELFALQEGDPEDDAHEQQLAAQTKLTEGDVAGALEDYGVLIERGQRLEGIIQDLNAATEILPDEIGIYQKLGDAYMRANRLEEALQAFTKAQELL
jgi:competence ComEA-like helix-hairpin-helix protein